MNTTPAFYEIYTQSYVLSHNKSQLFLILYKGTEKMDVTGERGRDSEREGGSEKEWERLGEGETE